MLGALIAVTACGGRVGDDVQNTGGQAGAPGAGAGARGDAESAFDAGLGGAGRDPEPEPPPPDGVPFPPTNAENPNLAGCECSPGGTVEIQDGALSLTLDTGTANYYCTDAPWLTYNTCLANEYFELAACGRDASGFACLEIRIAKSGDALTEFGGSYWDSSGAWEVTGGMGIIISFDQTNGTEVRLELGLLLVRGGVDRAIHVWVNACQEFGSHCLI
jgi:hypothetical protein